MQYLDKKQQESKIVILIDGVFRQKHLLMPSILSIQQL